MLAPEAKIIRRPIRADVMQLQTLVNKLTEKEELHLHLAQTIHQGSGYSPRVRRSTRDTPTPTPTTARSRRDPVSAIGTASPPLASMHGGFMDDESSGSNDFVSVAAAESIVTASAQAAEELGVPVEAFYSIIAMTGHVHYDCEKKQLERNRSQTSTPASVASKPSSSASRTPGQSESRIHPIRIRPII